MIREVGSAPVLQWNEHRPGGDNIVRASNRGIQYEIAEAMGDFVLWVKTKGKAGLVGISPDRDRLVAEAELFASRLVPYAEQCQLDIAHLVIDNIDHMSTMWTLLVSPELRTSEVNYVGVDQPEAK